MNLFSEMKQHEGHMVRIVLSSEDPNAQVRGKLIFLHDDGEAIIDINFNQRRYCWPVLEMECDECLTTGRRDSKRP